jgi:Ser/Thr protein kinase RdoA (MazF antagonist)
MIRDAIARFAISGEFRGVTPFGSGHINGTYRSEFVEAGILRRYVHQRINRAVFPEPEKVMANIARVLEHLRGKSEAGGRRMLTLIPARDGSNFVRAEDGELWRTYCYIEDSHSFDLIEDDAQAFAVARAIAAFDADLADLPGPPLHETIARFHDARDRFQKLSAAVAADSAGRVGAVRTEIDWLLARQDRACVLWDALAAGVVPRRICHNDAKANNVLVDSSSGAALCVVDLDTVMPGSPLFDFGDLVRTASGTASEDDPDPARMAFRLDRFAALLRGFLEGAPALTAAERGFLGVAGFSMTTVQAARFLTDHLNGDRYYACSRPNHNLDRARTQIALAGSMETQGTEIAD